jgi:signal transduction histidine kinase
MQLRLKQFVDERTHMLAAIAHDLRTPLTRLRLFAEYVDDQTQQRQLLSDIAEMDAMINSTLAFAGGEAKSEAHSRVDMAALLISLCDNACDAGGWVDYLGPDHAQLPCQPVAMRRALANLIENGCKYAGHVTVELDDKVDSIVIAIIDDGPGIAPEQIERAFAPFQRLEGSRNRTTGGTGLGLAIARDVIHGHGGNIHLLPVEPHGLLVRVVLPKPATPLT